MKLPSREWVYLYNVYIVTILQLLNAKLKQAGIHNGVYRNCDHHRDASSSIPGHKRIYIHSVNHPWLSESDKTGTYL